MQATQGFTWPQIISMLLVQKLSNFFLKQLGLKWTHADPSIFITNTSLNRPIVNTFIDDIKIMAVKKNGFIKNVKEKLIVAFSKIDMGLITFYLGFKIDQD